MVCSKRVSNSSEDRRHRMTNSNGRKKRFAVAKDFGRIFEEEEEHCNHCSVMDILSARRPLSVGQTSHIE